VTPAGSSRYFDFAPTDRAMTKLYDESRFVPQLELEFDAVLDDGRLGRALELLACRHRILGATVDLAGPRAVWRPDTTTPELVHVVDVAEFDPREGPTCRLVHTHDGRRSRVRFGAHHAVADGRGLLVLLDDLRAFYAALQRGERPVVADVDWTDRTIGALLDQGRVGFGDRLRMGWDAAQRWAVLRPSTHRDDETPSDHAAVPEPARDGSTRFERTSRRSRPRVRHGAGVGITCSWPCSPGRGSTSSDTNRPRRRSAGGWSLSTAGASSERREASAT